MTVASLGIQINSAPVEQAVADLDKLAPAADKAERAVTKFGRSSSASIKFFSDVIERMDTQINVLRNIETRVTGLERVMMTYNQTATKTAQANKAVEAATETMTAATQRAVTAQKQLNVVQIDARQNHVVAVSVTNEMTASMTRERSQVQASTAAIRERNVALKQANDNNARFRRQNLTYQAFDIGQTAAMGMNPAMILAQQGPQIAQLYAGAGGLKTALTDVGSMAGGVATRLWPVALAAAAGAAAVREMQENIREATGKSQTFGDVASTAFKTVAGDIKDLLQPAIDVVSTAGSYAFDKLSSAAIDLAEWITNAFRMASADIAFVWNQLPNIVGSAVVGTMNAVVQGTMSGVKAASDFVDTLIHKVNGLLAPMEKLGGVSLTIPKIGFQGGEYTIPDPYPEQLRAANEQHEREQRERASSHPIREYLRSVTERVGSSLALGLPDGGGGSAIPIPQLRGIDDMPGDVGFMQDHKRESELRVRQMQQEVAAIGMSTSATAALRFEQDALNEAYRQNIELNPDQLSALREKSQEFGKLVAQQEALSAIQSKRDQIELAQAELRVADLIGPARERAIDAAQTEIDIRRKGIELYGEEAKAMRTYTQQMAPLTVQRSRPTLAGEIIFNEKKG